MQDIHLKDIKKDQIFYERDCGMMAKFIALEDAYESGSMEYEGKSFCQWSCKARLFDSIEGINEEDSIVNFLITENHEHYGPKIRVGSPNSVKAEWKVTKLISENAQSENNLQSESVFVGELMVEPEVGGILFLMEADGMMIRTSKIVQIDGEENSRVIHTKNSKYRLEKL